MLRQQMTETMYDDTIQHVRHINFLNLILHNYVHFYLFSVSYYITSVRVWWKPPPSPYTCQGLTGIDKRSSSNDLYICIQSIYTPANKR